MTKFATFDLEVARGFPDGADWQSHAPLGISCAALGLSDAAEPHIFQGRPEMTREACRELVGFLQQVVSDGYTLVTWNGTAFDFAVLAMEADLPRECAELALAHVDLMVIVTCKRGHYLALQKALDGAGIPGKLKEVRLNDGSLFNNMTGKNAPELWGRGEFDAVLCYLREDVMPLLELAQVIERKKVMRWTSSRGSPMSLDVPKLWSVRESLRLPMPNTAWMKLPPPDRRKFIQWMPPLADLIPSPPDSPRELRELPLFAYAEEPAYWREFRYSLNAR
jgi:hypothetical protein